MTGHDGVAGRLDDCARELQCIEEVMVALIGPDDDTGDRIMEHLALNVGRVRAEIEGIYRVIAREKAAHPNP